MNSRVYPLKEAAGMVGINANVLRVMINQGDVLGVQILKGTRQFCKPVVFLRTTGRIVQNTGINTTHGGIGRAEAEANAFLKSRNK